MTVALIRAVENVRLTIFIFYQTHIFNGSNQPEKQMMVILKAESKGYKHV